MSLVGCPTFVEFVLVWSSDRRNPTPTVNGRTDGTLGLRPEVLPFPKNRPYIMYVQTT